MIGAIVGDILGAYYEMHPTKKRRFRLFHRQRRFTDDTVLTVAIADWILNSGDLIDTLRSYYKLFPQAGFGKSFIHWANSSHREPYNSLSNGSAMRVSPVGFAFDSLSAVLAKAKESAEITHNHVEGIQGAQATAAAICLARNGEDKASIRDFVQTTFRYDLNRSISEIRPHYRFEVSCRRSVPESIIAFLESTDYESAVRNAISLGGDADTMACIAGGIAEAYYGGVPKHIQRRALRVLDKRLLAVADQFHARYLGTG